MMFEIGWLCMLAWIEADICSVFIHLHQHRPLSSSAVLHAIVGPAADLPLIGVANSVMAAP
jgi:hypothetical protein